MATKKRAAGRAAPPTTVLVRVRLALFTPPERWSAIFQGPDAEVVMWSKPFRRRAEVIATGETPLGRYVYVPGLPIHNPLPFGRLPGFYALKSFGVEGDQLVLHVA
jgi:hypothetical protein